MRIFSAIDFPVHAEDPKAPRTVPFDANHNGDIDSDDEFGWYEIDSAEDLYWLAERINSSQGILEEKYFLKNDITVNLNVLTESGELNSDKAANFKEWTPIGIDRDHQFWGTFDGNNNTIRGLYYNSEVKEELGLFGNCFNATIKNVTIADSYFKGNRHVGGICGWDEGSTIENCHNTGTVESGGVDGKEIGGICGRSDIGLESSNIINCHNSGVVKGDYEVGGICGYISGCCITNCYNDGEITCTHQDVGGICGSGKTAKEPTTIKNCYNTGKVNCIYDSEHAGNCNAGGIIGFFSFWNNTPDVLNCKIENCYNTGKITGNISKWVGACCGRTDNLEIKKFYYLEMEDLYGVGSGDIGEVNRMTAEQFKTGEVAYKLGEGFFQHIGADDCPVFDSTHHEVLYNDSQYYNVHEYDDNGFCKLCDDYEPAVLEEDTDDIDNDGNKTEPVCIISNAGKLYWFANKVNSGEHDLNAVLADYISIGYKNDAVLDDYGIYNSDSQEDFRKWTPIGSDVGHHCYSGTFDGKGFAIWGLFCNNTNDDSVGLFGNVTGGTVKNVDICESYFHSNGHAGSIAGAISEKSTIENCHVLCDADINGDNKYAGLICGRNCESTIKNCIASGYVTATGTQACAGGICGCNNNGLIENCCYSDSSGIFPDYYSNVQGSITAKGNQACAGGICGLNCYNGKITNCYNTRTVSCSDEGYAGGICGWNNENGEVSNCYSTGDVSGNSKVGGVCGLIEGYGPEYIQNCYFLKAEGLNGTGSGDTNAVINEMTDEQFASGEVCWLLNGGDTQAETPVFRQNLSEKFGVVDAYPVLDSTHHSLNFDEEKTPQYYNEHSYENGFCKACDCCETAKAVADVNDIDNDGNKEETVYEISNAGQLYWFADKVNNEDTSINAVLTDDITVNSGVLNEDGELNEGDFRVWTPIGGYNDENSEYYIYSGTFDGNNKTISGLYFNKSGAGYVGLFGYVGTGGKIQDVTIADSYMYGETFVGGICGDNYEGTIENAAVADSYLYGNVFVGGVCGANEGGEITNCYNKGTVTGDEYVGGVCGYNEEYEECIITNCYYLKTEDLNADLGGIDGADVAGSAEAKDDKQFASGEVCWLLNGEQSDNPVFYQNIGKDISPVLDSTHHAVKHSETSYYNEHSDFDENGFCTVCDGYEPAKAVEDVNDIDDDGKTDEIVYEISNAGQLYWFADKVNNENATYGNANAFLAEDITVNENLLTDLITVDEDGTATVKDQKTVREWTPIGDYSFQYSGIFNGNNKTISGLYFNNDRQCNVGLFGCVDTVGKIQDVTIADSYMYGKARVGGICGANYGTIENVTIADSYMYGEIKVGGICGYNEGTITDCSNTGDVTGSNDVGGVCGYNTGGSISDCSNTGDVSGDSYVGGVCGGNTGTITNCYNTGDVTPTSEYAYVGGVCGSNDGTITNCYNTGDVTATSEYAYVGGVYGNNWGTITNCYYLADTDDGNGGKTASQFASGEVCWLLNGGENQVETPAFFQTLSEDELPVLDNTHNQVYKNTACDGVSDFYNNDNQNQEHSYENGFCTGCELGYQPAKDVTDENDIDGDGNTDETVYEISNAGQLYWFAGLVNGTLGDVEQIKSANAVLTADITVNSGVLNANGELNEAEKENFREWTLIVYYSGTFDGAGHTISGIYYNDSNEWGVGLFKANCGTIRNVGLIDSYICGQNHVGGICGYVQDNGSVSNCYNAGNVTAIESYVGGICGASYVETSDNIFINCYNAGKVSGSGTVGGICGYKKNGANVNCYNVGKVSGNNSVGGICGNKEHGTIKNCYYLDTTAPDSAYGTAKSATEFASGEVCWLLNGGDTQSESPAFYQNIGKDAFPVLDKHHTVIKNGESYKNNAHSYENGFCTICGAFEDGMGARLAGHSLTLDGSIGVNFYMELDKSVAEDENAYMHFTLPNGKTEDVNVSQAEKKNVNGMECYVFKCNVAAKEMTATIKAQMFSGDKQGTVYEYTVKEYADYLFANAYEDDGTTVKNQEYADAYALVESMVNYGAYSQIYFDYNTNALANAGRTYNVSTVTAEKVNKPYDKTKNNLPDGVSLVSANLELESETVLNLLFTNTTGKELTFKTSDDVTLTQTMTADGIKVTITNISAQYLSEDVEVIISVDGDTASYSATYSPMNYCYSVLSNDRTDELKNVMRAFWLYNQQAKAYFQNN